MHYLRVTVGKMQNQRLSAVWLCKSQNWWICKTSPCKRTEWISNTSVKIQRQEINVLASTSSKPEKWLKSYSSYSLKRQMKGSELSSIVVNISVIIESDLILLWLHFAILIWNSHFSQFKQFLMDIIRGKVQIFFLLNITAICLC